MKNIPQIKDFSTKFWRNKKVIMRVDFNLPVSGRGKISDWHRMLLCLPTIEYLLKKQAQILLISHRGDERSLKPVFRKLNTYIKTKWISDLPVVWPAAPIALLENIRYFQGEEENSISLAKQLALPADFYINEAFSASHREHASLVALPRLLPHAAGFLFIQELDKLSKIKRPNKPFLIILGGAKLETKLPLISNLLKSATNIFLGGIPANSVYKKQGWPVGRSLAPDIGSGFMNILKSKKLVLPSDFRVISSRGFNKVKKAQDILPGDLIVDIGGQSLNDLQGLISEAQTIFWNGPLGYLEKGNDLGTKNLYQSLLKASQAEIIIAGGDTLSGLSKSQEKNIHYSSGGGATLVFLMKKTLPGIEALK